MDGKKESELVGVKKLYAADGYRCRIEKFPAVGATPATIACFQVMEALKLIIGIGTPYLGKLLFWDGADMSFTEIEIHKKPDCPVCGTPS